MGMASNTDDENRVREDFARISSVFHAIADNPELGLRSFDTISMGMTHDWKIAVEEGATLVRIGSGIFGERNY